MASIDASDLSNETHEGRVFPAARATEIRVHFTPDAHKAIHTHAGNDTGVEICGVLVGRYFQDEDGPYVAVEDSIRCDSATSKFAEVTFTHESWSQVNDEMDNRHADKRIVGWYHSHPSFGIFLSDRDSFIHEHFFSGPGQIAHVVDPIRNEEGVFVWRAGKPKPLPYFWVDSEILPTVTVDKSRHRNAPEESDGGAEPLPNSPAPRDDFWSGWLTPLLLTAALAFLLGTTYGRWRTSWERQRLVDGVVANYTQDKLVKIGLAENLTEVRKRLMALSKAVLTEAPASQTGGEQGEEGGKASRKQISREIRASASQLGEIATRYSFDTYERESLARRYVAARAAFEKEQAAKAKEAETVAAENDRDASETSDERTPATKEPTDPETVEND